MAILRVPRRGRTRRQPRFAAWEPWHEIVDIENWADDFFRQTFSRWFDSGKRVRNRMWSPPADVYETDDHVVINAELPGMDPEQIQARIEGQTLFLKGDRKRDSKAKAKDYYLAERVYGPFTLSLALPSSVDPESVTAQYHNGVLTLTVAKREEAKPKTIKIQPQLPTAQATAAHN
jgi:HSP20 family protein